MPCIVAILALLTPRVVLFFIWLLTDWFRAFQTWHWPLLGFFFMPYTTLAYMAAMLHGGHITGGWLALIIIAALIDAGHWGGSGRTWRHRRVVVVKE